MTPSGWSYNPSSWSHRKRLLPLAALGLLISSYLALCQIGVISVAWDPFFHDGTRHVLHSRFSESLPFPDALLGAVAYLVEIILIYLGPEDRWRSRPWLTRISGLTALGVAAVSILLLILQPTVVHDWCTGCIASALTAFFLLQRTSSEFLASLRFPEITLGTRRTWTLFASALLGASALALPDLFGIEGVARLSISAAGALSLAVSIAAMNDALPVIRLGNAAAGSLLLFWFLGQPGESTARWIAALIGFALTGLCI